LGGMKFIKHIAVLVDYSEGSILAIRQAAVLARNSGSRLTGVHITRDEPTEADHQQLRTFIAGHTSGDLEITTAIGEGRLIDSLHQTVSEADPDLVILCTHGVRGLQHLFGSHVLKLVSTLPFPCLVVQQNSVIRDEGFSRILFPASPYPGFIRKAEVTGRIARLFGAKVIMYQVDKYLNNAEDALEENMQAAAAFFRENEIAHERVEEEVNVMSLGYARQTVAYAGQHAIDLISIMSTSQDQDVAILKADKEAFLTNEAGIPVLACNF
jgi:nucleotide-binding universal stress UspA family protein